MASIYDVFHIIALKGEIRIIEIVRALGKPTEERQNIRKLVLKLKSQGLVHMDRTVRINHNKKSRSLYRLILFCVKNGINYNVMFKDAMLDFLQNAARKEFFTRQDLGVHGQTFNYYTTALQKYGFLLIVSRKPLKCKLLRHHFLNDLLESFERKVAFYKSTQHSFIPHIKKEFVKYKRKRELGYSLMEELERKEELNFIHISLTLEGNPITLADTQKIILEQIVPEKYKLEHIQEVTNYKKAVDLMIANARRKAELDLSLILNYHKIAMIHIHGAGEIRKQNVQIKGNPSFKTCEWRLIPLKLNALMKMYGEFEKKRKDINEVIAFASFFHNEFQRIHPFIDGNSRLSRLLMLHILRSYNLPVLDLPLGYFDMYLDLTKRSARRDDVAFQHLIEEVVFFNLKRINSVV